MAQFQALRSRISLVLITLVMIVASLGACSKSKNTAVDASALAPVQGSSDGTAADTTDSKDSASDDCKEDDAMAPGHESESDDDDDTELALKEEKGGKGKKGMKDCPVPGTTTPPAAGTGTASLAEGQKIYAANCQSCHGALPGEMKGASATKILGASGVGAHKGIMPWPAGAASNLSAQDAAASLAEAMK